VASYSVPVVSFSSYLISYAHEGVYDEFVLEAGTADDEIESIVSVHVEDSGSQEGCALVAKCLSKYGKGFDRRGELVT
jgi:hypothetical protein